MEAVLLYDHRPGRRPAGVEMAPLTDHQSSSPQSEPAASNSAAVLELLPTQLRIREQLTQTSGNVGAVALGPIVCYSLASQLCQLTL